MAAFRTRCSERRVRLRTVSIAQRDPAYVLLAAALAILASVAAHAQGPTYQLGRTPSQEEIKARDIAISPEGKELPPGRGTAKDGATVYTQKCAACHGPNATGSALHRGLIPLGNAKPVKIPYSLVPYATTVWDFINRAMPQSKPGSLTPDEVYAVTAYVLYRNDIITETDVLDATSLPKIKMPNRDNFLPARPEWNPKAKRPFGYYP
jgi:S-disulfanyl-L-cysteine oxidoreductase SoxD